MKQELNKLLHDLKFRTLKEQHQIIEDKAIRIKLFKGDRWTCLFSGYYKVNDLKANWYTEGDTLKCCRSSEMITKID